MFEYGAHVRPGNGVRRTFVFFLIICGFFLSSCRTGLDDTSIDTLMESAAKEHTDVAARMPKGKITSAPRKLAAEGIKALDKHDYKKASKLFNAALKLDIRNSYLHFLNARTYHLRALQGESQLYPLSEQGYRMAQRFDESNWLSKYYLGLAKFDQGQFHAAKLHFASAVPYRDNDPQVLYRLATAAYYDRDVRTADAALRRLRQLDIRDNNWKKRVAASSTLIAAAQNQPKEARLAYASYANLAGEAAASGVGSRMESWLQAHKAVARMPEAERRAQSYDVAQVPGSGGSSDFSEFPGGSDGGNVPEGSGFAPGSAVDPKMVVVDVTIVRTEEDTTSSTGINLLSGLQVQFGDPLSATPGVSFSRNNVKDFLPAQNDAINTRTLTQLIGIPAITYSLNIANSQRGRNEILARPTLVARAGQTSEFFSGVEVSAAATSGGAGDSVSVEKEIGVKLAVTPEFLPNGTLLLRVQAERTFLTQPDSSVVFEFRLDTSKTSVNADVAMRFGQTLILSGLSERETEDDKDAVPGLEKVPIVNLAFSRKRKRDFRKSVMILLTPRRAQFLHRTSYDRPGGAKSDPDWEIRVLEQRYRDWFRPVSHTARIFRELRTNLLYVQEYRTSDMSVEHWNSSGSTEAHMGEAMKYIYK